MDIQNLTRNAGCEILADLQRFHAVVGIKQVKKAIRSGETVRVYLAEDADPAMTEPIEALCLQSHIDCAWVDSMKTLGQACSIDVGAAAAAAVRSF